MSRTMTDKVAALTEAEHNHLAALQKLVDSARAEGYPDVYVEHLSFWPVYVELRDREALAAHQRG